MTPTALLRRLLLALPTLLGVIVVVFVLLRLVPGDPVSMMISARRRPPRLRTCVRATGSTSRSASSS